MENFEKAEVLVKKTGISFEKANEALKACDYDVLEALVYLEKAGDIESDNVAKYSTGIAEVSDDFDKTQEDYKKNCKSNKFGDTMKELGAWIEGLVKKGCETSFVVEKKGESVINLPVIVLVILALLAFWVVLPLLFVGLFFDFRYHFEGFENTTIDINDVCNKTCDKASEVCESIKKEMKKEEKKDEE